MQDVTIGVCKENCKILLPVALCDLILVPGLRMSLVEGGSKVVISVILRLAAAVWPLSYRDPEALPSTCLLGENLHHQQSPLSILDTTSFRCRDNLMASVLHNSLMERCLSWASKLGVHAQPAGHSACMRGEMARL
jgi:hypothetical protein